MELPLKESRHGLGAVPPQILTKQRLNQNGLPAMTQASDAVTLGSEGERHLAVLLRIPQALLQPLVL